jgi:Flp pilus assembly protein TadD
MNEEAARLNAEAYEAKADGDASEAITLLEKALSLDPGNSAIHYNLALALKDAGDPERSERILTAMEGRARGIEAERAILSAALTLKGLISYEGGNREEAEKLYAEAIRLDPANPDPKNDLGVLMFAAGRYLDAKELFEEAARLDPTSEDILVNLRDTIAELGPLAERAGKEEKGII